MAVLSVTRAGPLATLQDDGRFGMMRYGIGASGPMDRGAFAQAGRAAGSGRGGIEVTTAGIGLTLRSGACRVGFAGGDFVVRHNGQGCRWPGGVSLEAGDTLAVTPGAWGNYGYVRFGGDLLVPPVLGSLATSSRVQLGGLEGRSLRAGDVIEVGDGGAAAAVVDATPHEAGPVRVIWGIHADYFAAAVRAAFCEAGFTVSSQLDRMGVRLAGGEGTFGAASSLSLVSDAIVPGDIQILGDGTPIVLMRDHQPTGGYPRIATVITADLDRFAQLRPGSAVAFEPVSVEHAHRLLRNR